MRITLVILLFMAFAIPALANRYALLIGNDEGAKGLAQLKYVRNDLEQLRSVLTDVCGFSRTNVTVLYNGNSGDVSTALKSAVKNIPKNDDAMFLLYYTGHADNDYLKLGADSISMAEIKGAFSVVPAKVRIGVFDACQSGAFTQIKGGKLSEPFLFRDDVKVEGQVILSASSANENAQESDAYGHSIFTFHFINALRGNGDLSQDGRVTLSEAYQYSYQKTVSATASSSGGIQHPSYQFRIQGEGDIVLADLTISTTGLILDESIGGKVTMLDSKGGVAMETDKANGQKLLVALTPGEYKVVCQNNSSLVSSIVVINDREIHKLQYSDLMPVKKTVLREKGEEEMVVSVKDELPEKGPSRSYLGITIGGGGRTLGFDGIFNPLKDSYKPYEVLGLKPDFKSPFGCLTPTLRFEYWYHGIFEIGLGFSGWAKNITNNNKSSIVNPLDGVAYKYSLATKTALDASAVMFEAGYRFSEDWLKNFALHCGIAFYTLSIKLSSSFYDELYDMPSNPTEYSNGGESAIPYAGLSYCYPVGRYFEFKARTNYYYQAKKEAFNGNIDKIVVGYGTSNYPNNNFITGLRYDLSGFEFMLEASFYLKPRSRR